MFASPPVESAILPKINSKIMNANNSAVPTSEDSEMRSIYSTTTTNTDSNTGRSKSLFNGSKFIDNLPLPHIGTSINAENNFINTPREYKNKARDEIKQLMIPRYNNNNNNMITPTTTRNSISDVASYQSSIFSRPSIQTNNSTYTTTGSLCNNNNKKFSLPPLTFVTEISLNDALPKTYQDMYSLETLSTSQLLPNGRPQFTQRALIDWELNDLRSLLIVDKLKPEWGNSIPLVNSPTNDIQLRIVLLPLICNENVIIDTLVSSDIYMEANLDLEFKWNTAKYIVEQVKRKHQLQGINYENNNNILRLNKIEWRNIIENYLLNIAVGVQCRYDFKQRCSDFKKWKCDNLIKNNDNIPRAKIVLTKDEKSILWSQCQAQVYQRLGLDWKPDKV